MKKYLTGGAVAAAAALMLPASLVGVNAAGAARVVPQPTVSGVTVSAATPGNVAGGLYHGDTIGYGDFVSFNVTGTNLDQVKKGDVTITQNPAAAVGTWTMKKVLYTSSNAITIQAYAPNATLYLIGNPYPASPDGGPPKIHLAGKYASPVNWTVSGVGLGSNCGPQDSTLAPGADPVNGVTGAPYVSGDFGTGAGQLPTSLESTLTGATKPTVFTNVYVDSLVKPLAATFPSGTVLCSGDLALPPKTGIDPSTTAFAASGFYSWATNFPLYFSAPAVSGSTVKDLSFSMPYTSNNAVQVSNTVIKYKADTPSSITGCKVAAPAGQKQFKLDAFNAAEDTSAGTFTADWKKTNCIYNPGNGVLTVTDTQKHNYSQGTFLHAPGVVLTKSGAANLTVKSITATIKVGPAQLNILFNPDPASANATETVFSW
jgi:hypothetical protein